MPVEKNSTHFFENTGTSLIISARKKGANYNMTTNEKENYSLQIIKTNDLVRKFFPCATKLEHVTDKERQLAGIDLIVGIKVGSAIEPVNIDVKMNYEENIPYKGLAIEIRQNGIQTLVPKATDYQLHIWRHRNGKIEAHLLYYPKILEHYELLKKGNLNSEFIGCDIKTTKTIRNGVPTGECIIFAPFKGEVCVNSLSNLRG